MNERYLVLSREPELLRKVEGAEVLTQVPVERIRRADQSQSLRIGVIRICNQPVAKALGKRSLDGVVPIFPERSSRGRQQPGVLGEGQQGLAYRLTGREVGIGLEVDPHGTQRLLLCRGKARNGRCEQCRLGRAGEVIKAKAPQNRRVQRIQGRQTRAGFLPNTEIADKSGFEDHIPGDFALHRDVILQQAQRAARVPVEQRGWGHDGSRGLTRGRTKSRPHDVHVGRYPVLQRADNLPEGRRRGACGVRGTAGLDCVGAVNHTKTAVNDGFTIDLVGGAQAWSKRVGIVVCKLAVAGCLKNLTARMSRSRRIRDRGRERSIAAELLALVGSVVPTQAVVQGQFASDFPGVLHIEGALVVLRTGRDGRVDGDSANAPQQERSQAESGKARGDGGTRQRGLGGVI